MKNNLKQELSMKDPMVHIHGLWGYYFKTNDFQQTLMIAPSTQAGLFPATDGLTEFPGIESETIGSVRFIGHIKAQESAAYQFSTSEITHTIIQINGHTVHENDSEPTLISMRENDICNIVIEYQMTTTISPLTNHELLLYWQINGGEKILIPYTSLYQPDLSAKEGDNRFINAFPAVSLFGTASFDQDHDGDKLPDDLEENGYTVDTSTLTILEWKDEYLDKGWQKYTSNPFHSHTAGDPYSDTEKVLNKMPSTDKIATDPLIAAFPAVGVALEEIIISKNEDFTNSKNYTAFSSKSWTVTGGAIFSEGINPNSPSGGVSPNFSDANTSCSTWINSFGNNVNINEADTAFINANVRYYNNGNTTVYEVIPTTSIEVDNSSIATVKVQSNEIGNNLGYGEYYPDKTHQPIVLSNLDQFSSKPIPINYQQFTAINDYQKPILLYTNLGGGSVAKYNFDGTITYESWTPYLSTMNERTARIVIDYGEEHVEQRIAGKSLDDSYDNTPKITLKQALIKAFGVTENTTDRTLTYKERDITETSVTIIYDQTTLDYMNKQMQDSKDYNIYNIILEPKMQFLIILPDLIDYVEENNDLFDIREIDITDGGINTSLAYTNASEMSPLLLFNKVSKGKIRENTRYLLSGYIRIERGDNTLNIITDENYNSNIINSKVITFNKNYNKFSFELNVFEAHDLRRLAFEFKYGMGTKFYFDNFTCVPLSGATFGDNLVLNPQFEAELDNWDLYFEGQNHTEILKEMGPHKENVLHFTIESQRMYVFSQSISVKKHTAYVFSLDINMNKGEHIQMSTASDKTYSTKDLDYLKQIDAMEKWHTVYTCFNSEDKDEIQIRLHGVDVVLPIDFMATNFKLRELNPTKE